MNQRQTRQRRDALVGYLIAFTAVVTLLLAMAATSHGAVRVCRSRVVQKVALPIVSHGQAYYQVAAHLQQQAVETYGFRQSSEYLEYLRLKGFEAGVAAMQQQRAEAKAVDAPEQPPALLPGPAAESVEPAPAYPALAQHCAKCHSGDTPKGDLWLDGTVSLTDPEAHEKRDKIVRMIRTGKMPPKLEPGTRLDMTTIDAIEDEIHGVEVVDEPPSE